MALKHNLLAILSRKPQTGYDLYKSIFEPMRPVRSIIYRQLNQMAKGGLVSFVRLEQAKYPARKVFSITEAGRAELNSWYQEPDHLFLHDPLQAQLWFGNCVDKSTLIGLINKYIDVIKASQEYYKKRAVPFINKSLAKDASPVDYFYWQLVLDHSDVIFKSYLKWCEDVVKKIEEFNEVDGKCVGPQKNKLLRSVAKTKTRKKIK